MNREFALQILREVETHGLEHDCALAREAYRYLERLKSTERDNSLQARIYTVRHNKVW